MNERMKLTIRNIFPCPFHFGHMSIQVSHACISYYIGHRLGSDMNGFFKVNKMCGYNFKL